jgi:hypothetical protein
MGDFRVLYSVEDQVITVTVGSVKGPCPAAGQVPGKVPRWRAFAGVHAGLDTA